MPSRKDAVDNTLIEVDEITLDGRRVRVRNTELPLESVTLDPRNPRIANTFVVESRESHEAAQKLLEGKLWDDPDVHDLYRQVLANKGLIERIIVRDDRTVVEGNCRTVVYRKLRAKFPKDPQWQRIPARLLPSDIGDREIAVLLGEMHIAGKNTWSPFEKAGHIYRLTKEFGFTQDEIATRLRMSKSKVNQLIRAFEALKERYMRRYPGREAIRKFSYFEELFKKPELRQWAMNIQNIDQFIQWVGENKLTQGIQVRTLASIIGNTEAYRVWQDQGYDAAKKVLESDNPALTSPLFRSMVEMTEALEQARLDDILRVRKQSNEAARRIVENLTEALNRFRELAELDKESD